MPRILIDGTDYEGTPEPLTWGALLERLDAALAPRGVIVTDVRFDGIDEPAFRDRPALDRPLAELAVVEVTSGTPAALMDRCLAEALASLDPLAAAAAGVGEQFRGHDIAAACEGLVQLIDGMMSLVGILGAAGAMLGVDLQRLQCGDGPATARLVELATFLETLVSAQETQDWITVADVLQYDVEPAIRQLAGLVETVRAAAA